MLTALVVTQTFGGDEEISVDARVVGVAAALVALRLRAHIIVAMVVAAADTALVRLALPRAASSARGRARTRRPRDASAARLASPITRSNGFEAAACHESSAPRRAATQARLSLRRAGNTANGSVTSNRRSRKR